MARLHPSWFVLPLLVASLSWLACAKEPEVEREKIVQSLTSDAASCSACAENCDETCQGRVSGCDILEGDQSEACAQCVDGCLKRIDALVQAAEGVAMVAEGAGETTVGDVTNEETCEVAVEQCASCGRSEKWAAVACVSGWRAETNAEEKACIHCLEEWVSRDIDGDDFRGRPDEDTASTEPTMSTSLDVGDHAVAGIESKPDEYFKVVDGGGLQCQACGNRCSDCAGILSYCTVRNGDKAQACYDCVADCVKNKSWQQ